MLIYGFCTILLIFLLVGCAKNSKRAIATQGVLDLSANRHAMPLIHLNGEWEFYWDTLLTPVDFKKSGIPTTGYLSIPGTWKDYTIHGETIPGTGYTTLRLRVILPENSEYLLLKFYSVHSAYKVWINGTFRGALGRVAESKESMQPRRSPKILEIPTGVKELDVLVQISNFQYRAGGINTPVILGTTKQIIREERIHTALEFFLGGAILIMALYHLLMYLLRKRDIASLYFGLFCLVAFLRTLVTGDMFLASIFGITNYALSLRIEYLTVYLMVPLFIMYTRQLFPNEIHVQLVRLSLLIASVLVMITLLTPVFMFTHLMPVYHPLLLIQFVWLTVAIGVSARKKRKGAAILLSGFVFIFVATIYDMLFTWISIEGKYILPAGIFCFLISQTYVLSVRFADAFKALELGKVKQRKLSMLHGRLAHMLDSVADAVLALDSTIHIRYMNKACVKLFACSGSLLNVPFPSIIENRRDCITHYLQVMPDENRAFEKVSLKIGTKKIGEFQIVVSRYSYEEEFIPVLIIRKTGYAKKWENADGKTSVESLISELNKNTERIRLFQSTIDTLNPQLFEQNPHLRSDLEEIGETLTDLHGVLHAQTSESVQKEGAVRMLGSAVCIWEQETGLEKSDLAEQSGLWNVQMDKNGWRRTQTLDKYLDVSTIPRNPKWKKIEKTIEFVLSSLDEQSAHRKDLKRMLEEYTMVRTPNPKTPR